MELIGSLESAVLETRKVLVKLLDDAPTNEKTFKNYENFLRRAHDIKQALHDLEIATLNHLVKSEAKSRKNHLRHVKHLHTDFGDHAKKKRAPLFLDLISFSEETLDSTQYENMPEPVHHPLTIDLTQDTDVEEASSTSSDNPNMHKILTQYFDEAPPQVDDFYTADELPIMEIRPYFKTFDDEDGDRILTSEWADFPLLFVTCVDEMLLQPAIEEGDTFEAYMAYIVSPLEFYIVQKADFWIRSALECLLIDGEEEFMRADRAIPFPGPGEDFAPDMPCLAWVNDRLYRALIRFSGFQDVQVFLIDYGTSHLVSPDSIFYMPLAIAHFRPGLAKFCTLADADSRMLETGLWRNFLETFTDNTAVTIKGSGMRRRTHGYLVQIIDSHTGSPLTFDSKPNTWKKMRQIYWDEQRARSVSPRVISESGSEKSSSLHSMIPVDELQFSSSDEDEADDASTSISEVISMLYKWK